LRQIGRRRSSSFGELRASLREYGLPHFAQARRDAARRKTRRARPRASNQHQEILMNTTSSSDVISSDDVEGTKVYNNNGDKLGTIECLKIDKLSGQVRYAVMEFGGFLGMNTDRYPIPWKLLKYDTSQEGYRVPIDKDMLSKAPRYTHDDAPPYTQEYGSTVDTYYRPYL
jgi:sporulation protein YlmC with PRC-barrel domain